MELKQLTERTLALFGADKVSELPACIMSAVIGGKTEIYDGFCALVGDMCTDWLQMVYQYYLADRKVKMQDYTPATLAQLVAALVSGDRGAVCLDMCAGSGALSIQAWTRDNDMRFVCQEYDENVIPLLLFNLAVRNIAAEVEQCDVLSGERFAAYTVTKGEKYAMVARDDSLTVCSADCCISNPPYNMKWTYPVFAQMQERFADCELPPENNANYAFVLTAINAADRAALILPCGVLSADSKQESAIREYLVQANLLEAVIACPDGMFEATGIPTCVLVLSKTKKTATVEMIDMRQTYQTIVRDQRGQYGGASHTNRVYHKEVKVFADEHINKVCEAIAGRVCEVGFARAASIEDIKGNGYILTPSRYIESIEQEPKHRSFADILADINRTIDEKNLCKLTISETLARSIGLPVEVYRQDGTGDAQLGALLERVAGGRMKRHDYVTFTKNKNEICFSNNSKTAVSSVLMMIFQMWKQHIYYLNEEENRYLAEMRDALLPELMSGRIEV